MIQVLFRMTLPSEESKVFIDDVDISEVGLRLLRNSIAIIPQTSFSFAGTIRYNLDPISVCTDE